LVKLAVALPDSVSFATAAALPLNYLTAHFALVRRAKLQPGETVLVQGAAGGVGSASCTMAAALGARVIAVVSSTEKVAIAEAVGAHHVVLADGFTAEVRQLTAGRGVDVIVDPVGGERFTDSLRSLAREGRLLVVGFAGGETTGGSIAARGGSFSLDELMFGGVQLVLGCVEQCCLFALGGNLEPPPPVQHDARAHRGSDHDHSRGRPPVRDDGGQDGNAHAGQDRMPLGARSPLHVFTLTAVEHHELTPWIRFGNRQSAHELATKAQGATTRFVEDAADPEQIDEEECPSPNL
jgi:zinc-binding dehydrogenase